MIKKAKSGKSAAGLLRYASEDPTAKLVLSNCGDTTDQQARFMRACASTNQKVKSPIGHTIVALPECEKKTVDGWVPLVQHIVREIGLTDDHPVVAYLHQTEKGQDLHIAYSRVSLAGEVLNDSNDKYLMASIEQDCEQRFNLRVVPRDQMKTAPRLNLGEVRQAERTRLKPARMVVADAIKTAVADRPTPQLFIERLRDAGVVAVPYVHNEKVKGFSFSLDGCSYKGKDVAASWTSLSKELNYVETRDLEKLTELSLQARTDTRGVEPVESSTPIAGGGAEVPKPSALGSSQREAQPARPARRIEIPTASVVVDVGGADADAVGTSTLWVKKADDPILKKMKTRQAIIDKLRLETGERGKLSQELAKRLENGDLYRQRETVKEFLKDNEKDPQAVQVVKEHAPDLAPITPNPPAEPAQELPERLRLADRYTEPTPSEQNNYQLPSM